MIINIIKETNKELKKLYKDIDYFIYNPLEYALSSFKSYLEKGPGERKIIFLGMNPGPFGMMQNGIPFGNIKYVKNYIGLDEVIKKPDEEHEKVKIDGFNIKREEISGRNLWSLIESEYNNSKDFFKDQIVLNYIQLAFLDEGGRNITPDKFKKDIREKIENLCDNQLAKILDILKAKNLIAVGLYAHKALLRIQREDQRVYKINHPSPLNVRYFKTWNKDTLKFLKDERIW